MENKFFITGLPRTRTTWFSEYLSHGDSFCLHEGFTGLSSIDEYFGRMDFLPFSHVGDANTGFLLKWREIVNYYNNPPVVMIKRDTEEVKHSCKELDIDFWFIDKMAFLLDRFAETYPCLVIEYEEINDRLEEINAHIGVPFDGTWASQMTDEVINCDSSRYFTKDVTDSAKAFLEV